MYSAGVSCVFLLHNTNRMDHFSEKNSAGSGGAYPKNEKIQVGSTGLLQELYHKDLSHPVTLYRIKDVVECDTKEDEIGYSNPLLSQHSVRRPYCFEYEPVSTYRMDSTTNSFDITNHMKPIYYDGTETPPSDTKYETRSQTMTSKILISIFVAIVLLASAFIGLLTWKRRNELSVKSASPPLLALVQLGILAALIRSSLYMFKLRIELCKAGLFFEILFYLAVLAPLAIKNWRLYLIFYNPHFSGLSNTRALIICGISILVPLAILVPVLITRDVELATIVTNGTELFAHYRKICPSSTVLISIYAELAVYLYIGMVIAFNIFVSFACRKLSHRYNESTKITLCCYNILIIIILTHLINGLSVQEKDESIPIIFTLGALITLIIVCGTTVLSNYTPLKKLDLGKTAKPSGVNIGGATFFEGGFNEPIRMGDWRPDPSIKDLSPAEEIQTFYCIVKIESRLFSLLDKEYMCQLVWIPSYNLIILMRFDVKSITHNSDKDINSKRSIFHVKECLMIREESMDKKNVVVILPGKRLTLKFETKSEIDKFCDALKIAF